VIGIAPVPAIRNETEKLLLRHTKARWVASFLPIRIFGTHTPGTDPHRSA
jgi:hypothetical protein